MLMNRKPRPLFYREKPKVWPKVLGGILVLGLFSVALYQLPPIQSRLGWRLDAAQTMLRTWINPIGEMPTPQTLANPVVTTRLLTPTPESQSQAQSAPTQAAPVEATPTPLPLPTATPLPGQVKLPAPTYERQDWNNCGPAALALYLRFYGWDGDQFTISNQIKPIRADRNVNIDELVYFVNTNVSSLSTTFRVGGNIDLLRAFIAAGIPVMIEETFYLEENFWYNDDRWSGHYQLLTGYDDVTKSFISQDSFVGPNRSISYTELDKNWQSFNRVFLVIYPPDLEGTVQAILGKDWDVDNNRQRALETARQETQLDPQNAFAWFNLGSNLTYFELYDEAAAAYDQARELELPQRMLRYQFGPFLAYFHSGRTDDLLAVSEYALSVTPNSEEALLWHGWALYRSNKRQDAMNAFRKALDARPDYADALYAQNFVLNN